MQSKFLSLEDRLRAEINEAARTQEKMTLDINNEVPFVRQGSGRRPGPRKLNLIFAYLSPFRLLF